MLGDFALGGFRVLDRVLRRFVCDTALDLVLMGLGVRVLGCRGFFTGSFPVPFHGYVRILRSCKGVRCCGFYGLLYGFRG